MVYTMTLIAGFGKNQLIIMPGHHSRLVYQLVDSDSISVYDIAYHFNYIIAAGADDCSSVRELILHTMRKIIDSDNGVGRKMALVEKLTAASEMVYCTKKIADDIGEDIIIAGADSLVTLSSQDISNLVFSQEPVIYSENGKIEFPQSLCGASKELVAARLVVCMDSIVKEIINNMVPRTESLEIPPEMVEEIEKQIREKFGEGADELEQECEKEKENYEVKSYDEIEKSRGSKSFDAVGVCKELTPFRRVNELVFQGLTSYTEKRGSVEDLLGADSIDEVLKIMDNMDLTVERPESKRDEDKDNDRKGI